MFRESALAFALFAVVVAAAAGCGQSNEKAEVPANPVQAPTELPGSIAGPPTTAQ